MSGGVAIAMVPKGEGLGVWTSQVHGDLLNSKRFAEAADVAPKSKNIKSSALRARLEAYEASCKQQAASRSRAAMEPGKLKMPGSYDRRPASAMRISASTSERPRAASSPSVTETEAPTNTKALESPAVGAALPAKVNSFGRPVRKLSNVQEQRVWRAGVTRLHSVLVACCSDVEVGHVPRTVDGTSHRLLGASFLERLLNNRIELKACGDAEAASAQSDLRHLKTEQLLAIRVNTLDHVTDSASHSARTNFLQTLDRHMFEGVALRCLRGQLHDLPSNKDVRMLGLQIAMVLGATSLIEEGWGSRSGIEEDAFPLPTKWALRLQEDEWPCGYRAALFDSKELALKLLVGEQQDFTAAAAGSFVAVVRDRSSGLGRSRMLHWEIAILDPIEEDILDELITYDTATSQCRLAADLSNTLAEKVASVPRPQCAATAVARTNDKSAALLGDGRCCGTP